MKRKRYFIIELEPPAPPTSRPGGLGTRSLRPMGGAAQRVAPPQQIKTIAAAELTPTQALVERKRSNVRVGETMPIRLIAPLAKAAKPAGDPGAASWGIAATGADVSTFDGSGTTLAVFDTGINLAHPAFDAVRARTSVKDFTDDAGTGEDLNGHGTHCAGTIFGGDVGGKRIGIARNPDKVLIGKVLPDDGNGDSAMLFDALHWASKEGANIVSMSLGFDFPGMVDYLVDEEGLPRPQAVSNALLAFSQNLRAFDALIMAFKAQEPFGRNMLVVGAAGNESQRDAPKPFCIDASLPSAATGVIPVAAYGRSGNGYAIAPFSNTRPFFAAPGVDILSADIAGGLAEMSGTSQACPHVAGLAALWWQKLGADASPEKVRDAMVGAVTTAKLPADCDEIDRGRGRVLAPTG